jgi:WNK lysine deficient protein kinase
MNNTEEAIIISQSPTGRYICYNDVVGRGAYKIVYRGYDKHQGKEVAWNTVKFTDLCDAEKEMIIDEVMLLKTLSPQNKYIINFHNAWLDEPRGQLHFITGLALSGTLKQYINKNSHINMRVIKKWCNQILQGMDFLHKQNIAHRDLKCNNIFINSNTGDILIGDLGLAKRRNDKFHSVIGTPEYMAPEMYENETEDMGYDEKVDIYAFGMCLLEMITKKVPYSECTGIGHIYKKVSTNVKPNCLFRIRCEEARKIIEKCINNIPSLRPSASELLECNFLKNIIEADNNEKLTLTEDEFKMNVSEAGNVSSETTTTKTNGNAKLRHSIMDITRDDSEGCISTKSVIEENINQISIQGDSHNQIESFNKDSSIQGNSLPVVKKDPTVLFEDIVNKNIEQLKVTIPIHANTHSVIIDR